MPVSVLVAAAVVAAVHPFFPLLSVAVVRVSVVPAPLFAFLVVRAIVPFVPLAVVVPALLPVMGVPVVAVPPVVVSVLCVSWSLPGVAVSLLYRLVVFGEWQRFLGSRESVRSAVLGPLCAVVLVLGLRVK